MIQLFRSGRWYESLDTEEVSGGPRICLAPEIMLRDDARKAPTGVLRMDSAERRAILRRAITLFRDGAPDIGGLGPQDPTEFATALGEIAGLPAALVRRWCELLAADVEDLAETVPDGASTLVWLPGNTFTCLVAVAEAVLRGATVVVRPSGREPLSAARFVAALLEAGWPAERICFYPTRTGALDTLIRATDRQIVYGGSAVAAAVSTVDNVDLRGPGRACAVVEPDADPDGTATWLVDLVAANSGRFCTNVCTVACLGDPAPLATRLGELLDGIELTPTDARWPVGWVGERVAERTADFVGRGMSAADHRLTRRELVVRAGGRTFLTPTLLRLPSAAGHPLAACELPFPFASLIAVDEPAARRLTQRSRFVYTTGVAE